MQSVKIPVVSLLDLRDVSIAAGDKMLLRGVNLTLQRGEIVALCGASGLGKTTLLRAIVGLDDAPAGSILLEDKTSEAWTYPILRRRVILVEQRPVVFDCSVEENLRHPFHYRSADFAFPDEGARKLTARLLLPDDWQQNARTLSQGQQQRLGLARALLLQPKVLLLDEPTSALDSESVQIVETLLREKAKNGLAILIVTHDRAQAARFCHRICEVDDWRI